MIEILIFGIALLATFGGVAIFTHFGKSVGLLDVPNERSSHVTPTPRGGGLVILLVCIPLYAISAKVGGSDIQWTYILGVLLLGVVSLLDDMYGLPVLLRLIVHGAAAALVILGCGAATTIHVPFNGSVLELGPAGVVLTFVWIVWLINAYNFMDGIDGIAGAQAVVAGLAWAAFGYLVGDRTTYLFGGVIAFSSLGFLLHNWSPASVFLGDVGSAFLGFTLASMSVLPVSKESAGGPWLAAASVLFVGPFVLDSVFTLVRRLLSGEKVWQAHRQHFYQRMVIRGSSHSKVSILYGSLAIAISGGLLTSYLLRGNWQIMPILLLVASALLIVIFAGRKKGLT